MKKSLLALAVLGAFASAASAQSTVTLSGRLDAGVVRSNDQWSMTGSQSGYNAFTLSGNEDLGGGMRAFFLMNHRFTINSGVNNAGGNAANANQFWRNVFVGLGGGFGDIRLGRMLMPLQEWNGAYDAFDTGTVGQVHVNGIFNVANVRSNSTIYYRTPGSLGGLFVHAAISAGEGQIATGGGVNTLATSFPNSERPVGFAVGYAAGPLSATVAYDKNPFDRKTVGLYGKYNFGFATLMGQYEKGDTSATTSTKGYSISAVVPVSVGRVLVGVAHITPSVGGTTNKFGLGGEYNLSKRTLLYSDFGKFSGGGTSALQRKAMFDLGVRHAF
jgi:predicted porin